MSKYTPGPWYVIDGGTDGSAISTKPQGNHDFDSEVLGYSEWMRVKDDDLVLMAAAPDLLDALITLVDCVDGNYKDVTDLARAAIAKATGETK